MVKRCHSVVFQSECGHCRGELFLLPRDYDDMLTDCVQNTGGEIKAGRKKPSRVYKIDPPSIKAVREKLDVSQSEFAFMIGVSTSTLQNWEQGRREPEGPAKALLKVASKKPKAVMEALHS